jgi:5S rRNA maturation endonuclease (ribonuclease M5)
LFGDCAAGQNNKVNSLSTKFEEKLEKIQQILTKLIEASAKRTLVVVEGKKDAQALKTIGVIASILMVKTSGKSFLQATEEIEKCSASEVILLLDFDRRGKEGTLRLQQDLEKTKIKVNTQFWRDLQALVGRDIACIESLPSYLKLLQERVTHAIR